ncbi:M56 family metallopeptidase [Flagellimonas algicola]|uniref:M56 family metallopeptidase n=1 Tax=Flagellimonas algicola TaxID=2583815 RepID=A0ABY2WJ65_9FLAO|nr:M56 family metallopeptidase [Allomuricauda algicola]TMU54546.1 M56 family metallopeptidase [Allomuricauda algicola]
MITYILESVTIQLVFLLIYDLLLKRETFLQWNRFYLLASFVLSLILPWIKIEALKTNVPENLVEYQTLFLQLDEAVLLPSGMETSIFEPNSWEYVLFAIGALIMTVWFVTKLFRLYHLKAIGKTKYYKEYTEIQIPQSSAAFSFLKNVFLGEEIPEEKQERIVQHELVHVKQWHSLDLIFLELMRIAFWFNPLVYLYQSRISELHEFIADAKASKTGKKEQYELLLSEVFHSQNFSLVNQFYKKSLIKKRIVMLTRKRSKSIYQLKYALLLPIAAGMLLYTSCETEEAIGQSQEAAEIKGSLAEKLSILNEEIEKKESLSEEEIAEISKMTSSMIRQLNENSITVDGWNVTTGVDATGIEVPFAVVEEVPTFPGCEDSPDKKDCFMKNINEHIRKHFKFPEEAQERGIQGRVSILFRINTEGEVVGIRQRGPHKLLEDEAVRIISKLPKMIPGKQKGKLVSVPFSMPISFKLD